jgi:hypothetical protein
VLPPIAPRFLEDITTPSETLFNNTPKRVLPKLSTSLVNDITTSVLPVSNVRIDDTVIPALWELWIRTQYRLLWIYV